MCFRVQIQEDHYTPAKKRENNYSAVRAISQEYVWLLPVITDREGEMIKQFYLALSPEWGSHEHGKVLLRQPGLFVLRRRPNLRLMAPQDIVLVHEHISGSNAVQWRAHMTREDAKLPFHTTGYGLAIPYSVSPCGSYSPRELTWLLLLTEVGNITKTICHCGEDKSDQLLQFPSGWRAREEPWQCQIQMALMVVG